MYRVGILPERTMGGRCKCRLGRRRGGETGCLCQRVYSLIWTMKTVESRLDIVSELMIQYPFSDDPLSK